MGTPICADFVEAIFLSVMKSCFVSKLIALHLCFVVKCPNALLWISCFFSIGDDYYFDYFAQIVLPFWNVFAMLTDNVLVWSIIMVCEESYFLNWDPEGIFLQRCHIDPVSAEDDVTCLIKWWNLNSSNALLLCR